jgi:soluble lytic murein transglycosylase
MKTLKVTGFIVLVGLAIMVVAQNGQSEYWNKLNYPLEYKEDIKAVANKYDLDPFLICAMIYTESKFDPSSISQAGAIGLMQVMPETGRWAAGKKGENFSVENLNNPSVNVDVGTWYYKYLLDKYKDEKIALAAYNSGYKNVDKWLMEYKGSSVDKLIDNIPFKETREFVERVSEAKSQYKKIYSSEFK